MLGQLDEIRQSLGAVGLGKLQRPFLSVIQRVPRRERLLHAVLDGRRPQLVSNLPGAVFFPAQQPLQGVVEAEVDGGFQGHKRRDVEQLVVVHRLDGDVLHNQLGPRRGVDAFQQFGVSVPGRQSGLPLAAAVVAVAVIRHQDRALQVDLARNGLAVVGGRVEKPHLHHFAGVLDDLAQLRRARPCRNSRPGAADWQPRLAR